jgi:putative phosphoesterase
VNEKGQLTMVSPRILSWITSLDEGRKSAMRNSCKCIGVISDTHGLLRPQVYQIFEGVDLIVHAGDIGKPEILSELRSIAPVIPVRGNNDTGSWARAIPERDTIQLNGLQVFVLHNLKELELNPSSAGFDVVISGHSHKPSIDRREGVLFLNPGSAGPRRFKLPISLARLIVEGASVRGELIALAAG